MQLTTQETVVLILVLMEYGLRVNSGALIRQPPLGLNPCFNGIWSARGDVRPAEAEWLQGVLILVLMEYGLREYRFSR